MTENALLVGKEQIVGDNIMFLLPDNLPSLQFVSSNSFDYATIKDCKVGLITSYVLMNIFRVLKPGASVEIIISQPIGVMQDYDSKQIEAHAEHAGFNDISIQDTVYESQNGEIKYPTVSVTCIKPLRSGNREVKKEVKTTVTTTVYKKRRGK